MKIYRSKLLKTLFCFAMNGSTFLLKKFFLTHKNLCTRGPQSLGHACTFCQISSGMRLEMQCTINVMYLNRPETIPLTPGPWSSWLSWNQSLVSKKVGNTDVYTTWRVWSCVYTHEMITTIFGINQSLTSKSFTVQFSSVTQSCLTLCDPMDCSTPGLPVHHQLPEFTQAHTHWFGDAVQPSHPLLSPSPPAFNLSQPQGLFKWVSSLHQVAKVLEFQLQQ